MSKLIDRYAQRLLLPELDISKHPVLPVECSSELGLEYVYYRPIIEQLVDETALYHGTGSRKINFSDFEKGKYEGTSEDVTNVIEELLNVGLVPHHDIVNPLFDISENETISLTRAQPYARIYAQRHLSGSDELEYEYGDRRLWFNVAKTKAAVGFFTSLEGISKIPQLLRINHSLNNSWAKDTDPESNNWMSALTDGRSEIEGDYPVIVGIKNVEVINLSQKGFNETECRATKPIIPDDFCHLQVPRKNLKEVESLLKELEIDLPVLAIEWAELYNYERGYSATFGS